MAAQSKNETFIPYFVRKRQIKYTSMKLMNKTVVK